MNIDGNESEESRPQGYDFCHSSNLADLSFSRTGLPPSDQPNLIRWYQLNMLQRYKTDKNNFYQIEYLYYFTFWDFRKRNIKRVSDTFQSSLDLD